MKRYLALAGWGFVLLGAAYSVQADEKSEPPAAKPIKDLDVGGHVPTTPTWVVASEQFKRFEGKVTCLAGVHRDQRAISIYARGDSPDLWKLLKTIDDRLADYPQIKAYVVIQKKLTDDEGYKDSQEYFKVTEERARAQKLKRVDVALARNPIDRLLGAENRLRLVYSNKRNIELCESFDRLELKPEEAQAVMSRIIKLAQGN